MPTIRKNVIDAVTTARLPRNTESAPELTPDEMGRELIFKISRNELAEFRTLLKNGANVNFCDKNTGNTPLHFLYYYGNCDVQYLELLLEKGAKISANTEGLFSIAMAEKKCNATELQKIKEIFDRYTSTPFNITKPKPNESGWIPYHQQKLAITIGMPIVALFSGVFAGGWEEIAQRNKEQYPYLPNLIYYGLKPTSLAILSAGMNFLLVGNAASVGVEDAWLSFAFYVGINYFGLMFAQLCEKFTKKIQNKVLNLLIPILLYTFYLNPSLIIKLLSDGFVGVGFQAEMMPLLSTLSCGVLFKSSKYATQKVIGKFFSIAGNDAGLSEQEILKKIQAKWNILVATLTSNINSQAYTLNFKEEIALATTTISKLLEKISEDEQYRNQEEYKTLFKDFEQSLINIQTSLLSVEPKIKTLYEEVTKILTNLRTIRPTPEEFADLISNTNHGTCLTHEAEQNIPLMTFSNYRDSVFPPPPSLEELQEIERASESCHFKV